MGFAHPKGPGAASAESDALLELGDEIVELAAHLHAGTQRMLTRDRGCERRIVLKHV